MASERGTAAVANLTVGVGSFLTLCPTGHVGDKSARLVAAEWCIRVFGAAIIVCGVAGNLATAYIQGTEKANRGTTRFLMVSLALTDCAVLLVAVVRYWLTETLDLDIRDLHPVICRSHQAVVATVSDVAVYTLCAIGVERFIAVAFPYRVQQLLTARNLGLAYASVVGVMVAKNAPIVFFRFTSPCVRLLTRGNNFTDAISREQLDSLAPGSDYRLLPYRCDYDRAFSQWFAKLDLVTFLLIPYTILLFCNVYIYVAVRRQATAMKRHTKQPPANNRRKEGGGGGGGRRKPESVMKILAVLTVLHIITTLPASVSQVLDVYGYQFPRNRAMRRVTLNALKTLMFANNATNFLAYFISSTAFRSRVLRFCRWGGAAGGGSVGEASTRGGCDGRRSVAGAASVTNGVERLELAACGGAATVDTATVASAAAEDARGEITRALISSGRGGGASSGDTD